MPAMTESFRLGRRGIPGAATPCGALSLQPILDAASSGSTSFVL
jgi:hypothetical protein